MTSYDALPFFALASLTAVALGCSGTVIGGPGSVTSLPPSDSVAEDAAQFCSDFISYVEANEGPLLKAQCASAASATGNAAQCQMEFDACSSAVTSMASSFDAELTSMLEPQCTTSLMTCTGVTVAQASQCLSDFMQEWLAVSDKVDAETACATHATQPAFPTTPPASCAALPSGCSLGSTVSVSMGSGGGSPPPSGK